MTPGKKAQEMENIHPAIASRNRDPRILIVTPEATFLPPGMGSSVQRVSARACGLGDISAALINALHKLGADVHVAIPNYRNIFRNNFKPAYEKELILHRTRLPVNRIHLAQDRSFFYHHKLFTHGDWQNVKISLAFQREVINRILPEVQPDLVHCHDWMTGLVPAMLRKLNIPCLFTLYNLHSLKLPLSDIEEGGIDAASFWRYCYYGRMPHGYEESRDTNPVDFLTSAVFSAHFVNTVSPAFLREIVEQPCGYIDPSLQTELKNKYTAGCLSAVVPAPDPSFNPATDRALYRRYDAEDHQTAKAFNKLHLQELLHLRLSTTSPLFYWPTRLDSWRSGSRLMAEVVPHFLEKYAVSGLELVFVADGDLQEHLRTMVNRIQANDRVAICDFDSRYYRLAYAGADFVLMPRYREPCGLPCKIGPRYGALPVAYDTGGNHDAVEHLDPGNNSGNGFLFKSHDKDAFLNAVNQAVSFFTLPDAVRSRQIARIMTESASRFDHRNTAIEYLALYEHMIGRPFRNLISSPMEQASDETPLPEKLRA